MNDHSCRIVTLVPAAVAARTTLAISTLRRRKRGRDTVAGVPSRFIAEMKLDEIATKEDPREKLKALRAAAAARAQAQQPRLPDR